MIIIRFLAAFSLIFFLEADNKTLFGQEPIKISITASYRGASLKEVIVDLEERYAVTFSYADHAIDGVRISAEIHNKDLAGALNLLLSRTPISFKLIGEREVVLYKDETKKIEKNQNALIQGVIIDDKTSEWLPYVNILIDSTSVGTYSDHKGRFTLSKVPFGSYYLRITDISHEYALLQVEVNAPVIDLDTIRLKPKTYEGENIVITGDKNALVISDEKLRLQPSVIVLRRKEINDKPGLLEPDLFRALQTLPGVTTTNDLSNELYVRGGTPDQNLITLDRAVVYQPYHMFGLAGIFNTDMIDYVNFSGGGFSAQYGNRMSSVIDLRTKSEATSKFSGSGTLSLLSSRLTVDGQIKKWYYMLSGRRAHLEQATQIGKQIGLTSTIIPYRFQDGLAKIVFQANAEHRAGFSGFLSMDYFQDKEKGLLYGWDPANHEVITLPYTYNTKKKFQWSNTIFNGFWEYKNDNGFLSHITLFQSSAVNDLGVDNYFAYSKSASDSIKRYLDSLNSIIALNPFMIDNQILDRTVKWDMEYELSRDHKLLIGGEFNRIQLTYFWDNLSDESKSGKNYQVFFDAAPDSFKYRSVVRNYAFYLEDIWNIHDRWTFRPGVRVESFGKSASGTLVSPRAALRYDVNPRMAVKAAAGIYYQSLFHSRERGYIGLLEIPFSTSGMKVQKSIHYILGVEYFLHRDSKITSDLYYKHASNLSKNLRSTVNLPVFINGESEAYGMELTWKRLGKKFSYELNYALAYVTRTFENATYYTNYDQRHAVSFMGNYLLPAHWSFDFRWVFTSGRAYRPASFHGAEYYFEPSSSEFSGGESYSEIQNSELDNLNFYGRFPMYHRLDISFIKTIEFAKWTLKPYINIINVYYKTNPLYYKDKITLRSVHTIEPEPRIGQIHKRSPYGIPFIPTIGAHFEF